MYIWTHANQEKEGPERKGVGTLAPRGKSGVFYLPIKIDGKVYTHPNGTVNLEEAKTERDRFLKTIRNSSAAKAAGHEMVTVSELLDDYVDHLRS